MDLSSINTTCELQAVVYKDSLFVSVCHENPISFKGVLTITNNSAQKQTPGYTSIKKKTKQLNFLLKLYYLYKDLKKKKVNLLWTPAVIAFQKVLSPGSLFTSAKIIYTDPLQVVQLFPHSTQIVYQQS